MVRGLHTDLEAAVGWPTENARCTVFCLKSHIASGLESLTQSCTLDVPLHSGARNVAFFFFLGESMCVRGAFSL